MVIMEKSKNYEFVSKSGKKYEFAYFNRDEYDGNGFAKVYLGEESYCTFVKLHNKKDQYLENNINDYHFKEGKFWKFFSEPNVNSEMVAIFETPKLIPGILND